MPIFRLQQLFLSQNKFLNYLNRFHLLTVPMPQCNCWRSRFLNLENELKFKMNQDEPKLWYSVNLIKIV
jgi:hypothetical protein